MWLLPSVALAQMLGIALADAGLVRAEVAWLCAAAAITWVVAVRGRGRSAWWGAVLLAFAAGAIAQADRLDAARAHRPDEAVERRLEGTIAEARRGRVGVRFELHDVAAVDDLDAPVPDRIRLYAEPAPAPSRVATRDAVATASAPGASSSMSTASIPIDQRLRGDRLRLVARLRAPAERHNPGSANPARAAERAGIGAVARLVHPALQVRLPEREGLRLEAALDARRRDFSARLAAAGDDSGLLRALALGDRSAPPAALDAAFARLGISHLLAVSGLHLALAAGMVFACLRALLRRSAWLGARWDTRRPALLGALVAAVAYALLAGWGVPVRRALLLLLGLAFAFASGRRRAALPLLAGAAVVVLAGNPAALFEPGAQLSFLASLALIAAARRAPAQATPGEAAPAVRFQLAGRFAGAGLAVLRTSASVIALTAPVVALHFGRSAPFALAVNLVAVPWTAFVLLPSALVALAMAAFAPAGVAEGLLAVCVRVAEASSAAVLALDAQLPVVVAVGPPSLGSWLALVGIALVSLAARSTTARAACALAGGLLLAVAPPRSFEPAPPRLVVLDVGQGDAIVVQGRSGAVLIDAGRALQGGFDVGERVVVPALAALGIRRLDVVVATHADLDHRGGLPAVLRAVPVGELWLPFGGRAEPGFSAVLEAARARELPVLEHGAGDAMLRVGDLAVTPLWPPAAPSEASSNDRSLVVRIEVAGSRLLLPGDIEATAEARLLEAAVDVQADVITLPHHGSVSSSSQRFFDAVAPSVGIASAPCRGRYRMPHPAVLARSRAHGTSVWWTGRDGAVLVGLTPPLHVVGMRDAGPGEGERCGRSAFARGQ